MREGEDPSRETGVKPGEAEVTTPPVWFEALGHSLPLSVLLAVILSGTKCLQSAEDWPRDTRYSPPHLM